MGRLGGLQLSAAVLAQSVFNVTGQQGLSCWLDHSCVWLTHLALDDQAVWGAANIPSFATLQACQQ